jgi:pseudouridine-5'-phosphate glycosidase
MEKLPWYWKGIPQETRIPSWFMKNYIKIMNHSNAHTDVIKREATQFLLTSS